MKKKNYLLLFIIMFCLLISKTYAITIRETMDENDGYSTLEEGSIIIGVTRFSSDTIVTASKAATAGVNDVILYLSKNGSTNGYQNPGVYYYVDPYVGWFFLDVDNNATPIDDEEELEKLSNLDIYYTNNVEKVLEVDFPNENIDTNTLPDGVTYKDNKLYINATLQKVEFETIDDKRVSLELDPTTSTFIESIKTCYTVSNGTITSYNKECGSDIVIPIEINEEKITAIGSNAFKGTNLTSVVIPSEIISIGSNAFADNKLETVIIKEKYDSSNFEFYGDNVFDNFNNIIYDNELTRMLNYVEDDYKLRYYKAFDIESLTLDFEMQDGIMEYLIADLIEKIEKNNNNKIFKSCWKTCDYESQYINGEKVTNKDIYGIALKYLEDYKYNVTIEKYDVTENKVYTVNKEMVITLEETGIKEDYNIVLEAIENLQMDGRYEYIYYDRNGITRLKYLEELEDLYDIEVILEPLHYGLGISEGDKITYDSQGYNIFYLKNGVLYANVMHTVIVGYENHYKPTIVSNDYESFEVYVEEVIKEFVKDTGVSNYYIYPNENGNIYGLGIQKYTTGTYYEIELIDIDYSEKWKIEFIDYYEDKYDENGFTKTECFGFENGTITSYDGTCGANVKIPNQINDIDVIKIDKNVFSQKALLSVTLPNKLKEIGYNAFYDNKLTEITIPETVTKIDSDAFWNNNINSLALPNSLTQLGNSAFGYNQIEIVTIGNNLEEIGYSAFLNNKIKKLEIPENVKQINGDAFKDNEIEELILNEGLEKIGYESFRNNKIKSLTIPTTVKRIEEAAFNNNQLENDEAFIYDRIYDEENDTLEIDYETIVSYGGKNRENVVIPSNVKVIGDFAFFYNDIEKIELPYGLEVIEYHALSNNKLTSLSIPNTVKEVGIMAFTQNRFEGDNSFIYMHDENGKLDKTNLIAYVNSKNYEIKDVIVPNTVKKIWSYAISYGTVNNLFIPYGVEEIDDYAFQSLKINNQLTLPKSIKKLGKNIFDGSSYSLEENLVYARNEDDTVDKTILMGYKGYFDYDEDNALTLPEGIIEIRENVFAGKSGFKKITLPSTLEKIGDNAFYNTELDEVTIPSNVKSIGNNAFNKSYGTLNIFIENKTTEEDFEYLGDNPFGNANKVVYENMIEVTGLILNKSNTTLSIGETETLIATIEPSNATDQNIKWSSSNPSVATVENGVITTLNEGTAIIIATLNGYASTCKVTVTETYNYIWEEIKASTVDEYYLYIVNSKGEKVDGKVNITYQNDKTKEHEVSKEGLKIIKSAVNSVEIISVN